MALPQRNTKQTPAPRSKRTLRANLAANASGVVRGRRPIKVGPQGRIVIPAEARDQLGIVTGTELVVYVEDGRLCLETRESLTQRIQEEFQRRIPPGVSLVDDLHEERRLEFEQEEREMNR